MKKHPHLIACCLFFLVLSQRANAELSWRDHERSVAAGFGQEEIVEGFHFTNNGRATTIRKIETSCGCTTAKLDKMTYAPGESGVIRAMFKIGSLTGTQIKTIKVFTDDPDQPEVHLTLKVIIPELLRITPRLVFWRPNEKPEPRTIDVTVTQDKPIKLTGLKTEGANSTAELNRRS